jgi:hypothetical protein
MANSLLTRVKHGWNAFINNRDPTARYGEYGGYSYRPDRRILTRGNERSIITSLYNRIALDVAATDIMHCRLDDNGRYVDQINSGLNERLTLSANVDQSSRAFMQDAVLSMFDEGVVALVPVETDTDPNLTGSYEILSLRTGKIVTWYPSEVKIRAYDERTGKHDFFTISKESVAIVENPFYSIMNAPNSTHQRLIRKLALLDNIDEMASSGKLDMILQLPYTLRSDLRKQQADERRKAIEMQLKGSDYGIAYIDGTEKITQLNRPVENNMLKQIEYLTNVVYSQLGITQSVLDGTADEKTMLNYYNRTIEPIVAAIVDEMNRKFLTKTARTQKQAILYFRDPFKLVPVNDVAEIADKFTRNEIMTSNEIRQIVGMKPSDDPKADKLVNSNIAQPEENNEEKPKPNVKEEKDQNGNL